MPTLTYDLISEQVLASSASTVSFSSITGTYQDLVIEFAGFGSGNVNLGIRFNGDTGTNYSRTFTYGDGTTPVSSRASNVSQLDLLYATTSQGTQQVSVFRYANTGVFKACLEKGATSIGPNMIAGVWRSTAAITSITITADAGTIQAGSVFRLWGIA